MIRGASSLKDSSLYFHKGSFSLNFPLATDLLGDSVPKVVFLARFFPNSSSEGPFFFVEPVAASRSKSLASYSSDCSGKDSGATHFLAVVFRRLEAAKVVGFPAMVAKFFWDGARVSVAEDRGGDG